MNSLNSFRRWDIFCRVIDNFGDIGVCWRLARQLANEYPFEVRLWVDDIQSLKAVWPTAESADQQIVNAVDVRVWKAEFSDIEPADVVIEAFACDLPANYISAMKTEKPHVRWFNLEYLSAERWVDEYHGLASINPQNGLRKIFYFPGFTAKTGGLPKESGLLAQRDGFIEHEREDFLARLGIHTSANALLISLFAYENPAVGSLIKAWAESDTAIICLIPAGKILGSINKALGITLSIGDIHTYGNLTLYILPFLTQTDYDKLLWSSDVNFVRGEDSFVRAQWAGKPFVWHIYPQDDGVHIIKLDAFLKLYGAEMECTFNEANIRLWHTWNTGEDCSQTWKIWIENYPKRLNHSHEWCKYLDSLGDLAANLVHFCQKTL